ncbi:signal peptidase I [Streptomyces sp. NBC_00094]|uniref:signal peptidase I n=1 Tax=Streptomyces sp. NBC_00094 TaxID=2903620 RepID=UPI002257C366|nr:signal peptidase I [Streptomyces sp. NBC_00094]MCX5392367.1 signal peptidase I [Streptomyces sp. NBC_00094]
MRRRGAGGGLGVAARVLVPLGLVLALGGIGYFFVTYRGVTVMGEGMEPTYHRGERLVVERVDAGELRRGDVVLFHVPGRYGGAPVLQRVIGTGGDRVVCDGDRITVNGVPVDEPYVMRGEVNPGTGPYDVRVPDGRLFLLGDHRGNSHDSRFFLGEQSGSVAASGVIGRAQEGFAAPAAWGALGVLGIVVTLVGTGLGIGAYAAGRSARRSLAAVPPWPMA